MSDPHRQNWRRQADPAARLKELRNGTNRTSKHNLLIVNTVTTALKELFPDFMVVEEGGGLYSHKFYNVVSAVTPTIPKYQAWWWELEHRSDHGRVEFL